MWIPGHPGISGNEKIDELARKGSGMEFVRPEPTLGKSGREMIMLLLSQEAYGEKHDLRWDELAKHQTEGVIFGNHY